MNDREVWRILVGLQVIAVALVVVAVVVIWILGMTSDLFGHR